MIWVSGKGEPEPGMHRGGAVTSAAPGPMMCVPSSRESMAWKMAQGHCNAGELAWTNHEVSTGSPAWQTSLTDSRPELAKRDLDCMRGSDVAAQGQAQV